MLQWGTISLPRGSGAITNSVFKHNEAKATGIL